MAITKVMHMKASKYRQIDVHLKQAITYILKPKKLGDANLVGGINCLPEKAYEMMKTTKKMFQKTGGRQGYHLVISLRPGELFQQASADIRAMTFHLEELDYKVGVKVYCGVLEKLGIQKDLMEIYDEFDEVYKESMTDKKKDEKEWRR